MIRRGIRCHIIGTDVQEMRKPLLEVILASDKRKKVLLLLRDEAKEMVTILKSLNTTRQAILPQIRILENHHLINHYKDTYEITVVGKLIIEEMVPLVGTLEVFDKDIDYWGGRELDFIPSGLLQRIHDLSPYKIFEPQMSSMHHPNAELIETTASSKRMCAVTNIFHPNFMDMFALWIQNEVEITMILSGGFLENLKTHSRSDVQQLMANRNIRFYLYDKPFNSLYFALNDHCILLAMLRKEGWYDERALISYSSTALEWGKDLFEHYMKSSTPITET